MEFTQLMQENSRDKANNGRKNAAANTGQGIGVSTGQDLTDKTDGIGVLKRE